MGGVYNNSVDREDYRAFFDSTAQLRQDLADKQGKYNALMAKSNPDPKRAAELSRQITALHDQLRSKVQAYSLPVPCAGYGSGPKYGYSRMGGGRLWLRLVLVTWMGRERHEKSFIPHHVS